MSSFSTYTSRKLSNTYIYIDLSRGLACHRRNACGVVTIGSTSVSSAFVPRLPSRDRSISVVCVTAWWIGLLSALVTTFLRPTKSETDRTINGQWVDCTQPSLRVGASQIVVGSINISEHKISSTKVLWYKHLDTNFNVDRGERRGEGGLWKK